MKNTNLLRFIPIMLAFFIMGYVDLVGISTNYIKDDLKLSDTVANLLPFMVFLWFLILSVPTGILMNRIGRRNTVIMSIAITLLAMLTPLAGYSLATMMVSFSLLGIGNTLMQVSLNPLVTNVVSSNRLPSSLTLGQFVKAIASFLAPIIAAQGVLLFNNWRVLYLVFAVIAVIPAVWLAVTPIEEVSVKEKTSTFKGCFGLLGDKMILLLFIGILMHVGIDVGINLTAPKILIERIEGMTLADAGYATSLYFLLRTVGCFSGAIILTRVSSKAFFTVSVISMLLGITGLFFFQSAVSLYVCIGLMGIGNSNIFPILFSQAMHLKPERNNEVSGLMIMGVSGGAVIPPLMGIASDAIASQTGAIVVLSICVLYLAFMIVKIK